jgi:tripartite-type tricarboxylate transporter receptor subunit TctC
MPELPTIAETDLPGFEVANWAGLLGPAGMDQQIVAKLHDEIVKILNTAEMRSRIQTLGFDIIASTPDEFREQMTNDVERWSAVVRKANIPLN